MILGLLPFLIMPLAACQKAEETAKSSKALLPEIRILLDSPPLNLHPRQALDSSSQRIGALLFLGLTQKNADLQPVPGLAEKWWSPNNGKTWHFKIKTDLKDFMQQVITAADVLDCMENYRKLKPASVVASALPYWQTTHLHKDEIVFSLNQNDPYFPQNASLLRFFRMKDKNGNCNLPDRQVQGAENVPLIGSNHYSPLNGFIYDLHPERDYLLKNMDEGLPPLRFIFVSDEATRALTLLRGDVDVAHNALSLAKTSWFEKKQSQHFWMAKKQGVNVTYLAFNLKDKLLSDLQLRKAIALAIDRNFYIEHSLFGFGELANSFLSPLLPESDQPYFSFDRSASVKILDELGYHPNADGIRLTLNYKTTPSTIGLERALIIKDMLKKVGIDLRVDVVENAVYFASIKSGNFQLFSSRWIGVSDASIFYSSLHSNHPKNRTGYRSDVMDALLQRAVQETDLTKRKIVYQEIQGKMLEDLPYFPLWFWHNTTLVSHRLKGLSSDQLSLTGALEPLTSLQWKE